MIISSSPGLVNVDGGCTPILFKWANKPGRSANIKRCYLSPLSLSSNPWWWLMRHHTVCGVQKALERLESSCSVPTRWIPIIICMLHTCTIEICTILCNMYKKLPQWAVVRYTLYVAIFRLKLLLIWVCLLPRLILLRSRLRFLVNRAERPLHHSIVSINI